MNTEQIRNEALEAEILALHRKLSAETLRADQMTQRYESANADRNALRESLASRQAPAAGLGLTDEQAQAVNTLNKIRQLCNGGPFDLTDSPKSFISNVRALLAAQAGGGNHG